MKTLVRVAACAATMVAVRLAGAQEPTEEPQPQPQAQPEVPAAPAVPPAQAPAVHLTVQPFASIVGGLKLDTIIQAPNENREARISAISVADFGLRGKLGEHFTFVSELLAGGGGGGDPNTLPGFELHGSSTWQGQAQLQVRQQLVRYAEGRWMAEVASSTRGA
jgi:hypothetical protein